MGVDPFLYQYHSHTNIVKPQFFLPCGIYAYDMVYHCFFNKLLLFVYMLNAKNDSLSPLHLIILQCILYLTQECIVKAIGIEEICVNLTPTRFPNSLSRCSNYDLALNYNSSLRRSSTLLIVTMLKLGFYLKGGKIFITDMPMHI